MLASSKDKVRCDMYRKGRWCRNKPWKRVAYMRPSFQSPGHFISKSYTMCKPCAKYWAEGILIYNRTHTAQQILKEIG
jgi:hypothetical protein